MYGIRKKAIGIKYIGNSKKQLKNKAIFGQFRNKSNKKEAQ
jgi:hypothetical protein